MVCAKEYPFRNLSKNNLQLSLSQTVYHSRLQNTIEPHSGFASLKQRKKLQNVPISNRLSCVCNLLDFSAQRWYAVLS